MLDTDTFLTELCVMADDFCKSQPPADPAPGPKPSLTGGEVIALPVFSQWARFRSERDFCRYAQSRLRPAFPALPRRSRFNRLARGCCGLLAAFSRHLTESLQARHCLYEALGSSAVPVRCAKRRGPGWYLADKGFEDRELRRRWQDCYGARIIHAPKRNSKAPWPKECAGGWPGCAR